MGENIAIAIGLFFLTGVFILMVLTWTGHLISGRRRAQEHLDAAHRIIERNRLTEEQRRRIQEQIRERKRLAMAAQAELDRQQNKLLRRVVAGVGQDRAAYKEKYGSK